MIKQYRIRVKGKVQRVGFRDKVDDLATDCGLSGYVLNLPGKDVFILVEGPKEDLDKFFKDIQMFPPPVKIKSIEISECPVEEIYDGFRIIRGEPNEELAERFDSALYLLTSIDNKQDQMLVKQDQMIQIQYETLYEIKEIRKDLKDSVIEVLAEVKSDIKEIKTT
jgi:acylphosphatase